MGDTSIHDEVARFRHGRVPRDLRERQVLAVAEELFAEQGYEHTSMEQVAARAGVSKPVVYDLVGSKEELFARVFARAGEELLAAVSGASAQHLDDPDRLVRAGMEAFLRFLEDHARAWATLFSLDAGGRTAVELQAIRRRQSAWAAGVLAHLAPEADPDRVTLVADALTSASEAVAHWRRDHPDASIEQAADWWARLILPGLRDLIGGPVDTNG